MTIWGRAERRLREVERVRKEDSRNVNVNDFGRGDESETPLDALALARGDNPRE
jgi:hypothetical protein